MAIVWSWIERFPGYKFWWPSHAARALLPNSTNTLKIFSATPRQWQFGVGRSTNHSSLVGLVSCSLWDRCVIGWIFWRRATLKVALAFGLLPDLALLLCWTVTDAPGFGGKSFWEPFWTLPLQHGWTLLWHLVTMAFPSGLFLCHYRKFWQQNFSPRWNTNITFSYIKMNHGICMDCELNFC